MNESLGSLVSVVIPFYNSDNTIEKCLDSIVSQTVLPKNTIIVVDGCKDIELRKICNKEKYNILNINILKLEKNSGPSIARNFGVKASNSEFIAFLDADDCWNKRKIEIQLKVMIEYDLNFSCHKYDFIGSYEEKSANSIKIIQKRYLCFRTYIYTPTVMVRREKFINFPADLKYSEDYYCWMNNIIDSFILIDGYLAFGHKKPIGSSGLSANIYKMHKGFVVANIRLFKEKKINIFYFLLCLTFEYLKFPIRYIR